MDEKEEKRIRVLELKHQELMTKINTDSMIIVSIFVMGFVVILNLYRENVMANIVLGLILLGVLIWFGLVSRNALNRQSKERFDIAKNIRDQIFKLEEEEKQKEDKSKS
ncbi:MAG: hypothetical protein PHD13_04485 [Methanocellales archaeon]|nr:hypothetical protein [Methanocellales archaeon]MDD3291237.1 hypothetical protein [Methanocellales archaeon]MDD5235409.1 hypothetical protein [Methanocellales archaeon]MDD5484508.1 hypothetical protein [Methanocellales archaeon]